MTNAPPPAIRDAATVIVLDRRAAGGAAVLMGQRGVAAAFMPSKFVFPGGAVDLADSQVTLAAALDAKTRSRMMAEPRPEARISPEAIAAAALRELAEETGLTVGRPGAAPSDWDMYQKTQLQPDPTGLVFLFRAITPPGLSRRFDARFLVLDADYIRGDFNDFSGACDELSHLHWVSLTKARALDLPFITEVVLAEVSGLIERAKGGALIAPPSVPFFDNRDVTPRFLRID